MDNSFFLGALEGGWRFRRAVTLGIAMQGTARFTRLSPERLGYREEGRTLEAGLEFTRAYQYAVEGSDVTVFYADGPDAGKRFLHFQKLIGNSYPFSGKADHLCGEDHYAADFTFLSSVEFSTRYEISGPKKQHAITTHYTKL